jgi:hypothetical protein
VLAFFEAAELHGANIRTVVAGEQVRTVLLLLRSLPSCVRCMPLAG